MPEYQYRCKNCTHLFTIIKPMISNVEAICPKCNSKDSQKIYTPINVVYNSQGFYKTDNRIPLTDDE
jgi:putative FmdB family regulatory protein